MFKTIPGSCGLDCSFDCNSYMKYNIRKDENLFHRYEIKYKNGWRSCPSSHNCYCQEARECGDPLGRVGKQIYIGALTYYRLCAYNNIINHIPLVITYMRAPQ